MLYPRLGGAAGGSVDPECVFTTSKANPMETTLKEVTLMVVLLLVVFFSGKV
jgi:hypothetical protein